ncbi:MAG: hypothetical protein KAW12_09620 [Candidatus Aminicenantes bacterium]|nr:hypothetical protein [Candidatus Aminicenantes bacterium]
MDKVNVSKIVKNYIKSIDAQHFQGFCDRLLLRLYPDDYTPVRAGGRHGDMKNDGYCYFSRKFFQAHASRGEKIANIKKKIQEDLEGCIAKQRDVREFIYITNDIQVGEVEHFVDELRVKHPDIEIKTWGPEKIALEITQFPEEDTEHIIDMKLSGPYQRKENDFGIIEEIFKFIFEEIINVKTAGKLVDKGKLRMLSSKIEINFEMNRQEMVKQTLTNNWKRMRLVERFVQAQVEIDETRILALKDTIQDKFCSIRDVNDVAVPITDFTVFEKLSIPLLPVHRQTNPDYIANAKSIILYFFEFCDIGKKTGKEEKHFTQKNLFKGLE